MKNVEDTSTRILKYVARKNKEFNLGLGVHELYELAEYYYDEASDRDIAYEAAKLLNNDVFEAAYNRYREENPSFEQIQDPEYLKKYNKQVDQLLAEAGETYTDADLREATRIDKERNRYGIPEDEIDESELYGDDTRIYGYDDFERDTFLDDEEGPRLSR